MSTIVQVRDRIKALIEGLLPLVEPTIPFIAYDWLGNVEATKNQQPREFEVRPGPFRSFSSNKGCDDGVIQDLDIVVRYPVSFGALENESWSWEKARAMSSADSAQISMLLVMPPIHWGLIAYRVTPTEITLPEPGDEPPYTLTIGCEAEYMLR